MRRRHLAVAGVGAALVGAGLAGWMLGQRDVSEEAGVFWSQSWESPDGNRVAAAELHGRPLLLNFWATWCPPCVDELPLLDAFHARQREAGWQLLGLAVDQPSAVRAFLRQHPLRFPVGLAGLGGTELSRQLGNASGGLPFSVLFDRQGRLVERKLGRLEAGDLERWRQRA